MPKLEQPKKRPFQGVKDFPPTHCLGDGRGGLWTHDGWAKDCTDPRCMKELSLPAGYSAEHVESWTDEQPDPLAPCPLTGRAHRWTWADDGIGHSGDVCACGAVEE